MMRTSSLAVLAGISVLACQEDSRARLVSESEFGVLFGGQVQERTEVPLEFDPLKLTLSLRIHLRRPLAQAADLRWELSRPGPRRGALQLASPESRVTEFGTENLPSGTSNFEKRFNFQPRDNPGLWNVRASVNTELALDRPFTVYLAAERPAQRRRVLSDAGAP